MRSRRFQPAHLGGTLQSQYLDDYQITAEEFALAIRVPIGRAARLLAGEEPVDADMALRLARLFGGSADGWLHWQSLYELGNARERLGAALNEISPLDPDTRLSVLEDEPVDPELIEDLRQRLAEGHDPHRWVIVSRILGEDVPLHEESLSRMFYNVESDCYSMALLGATAFKCQRVAEAVGTALGKDDGVQEVTKQDLKKPQRDEEADRELRERYFRSIGQGMSKWEIGMFLRDQEDMAAYLKAAAEKGDSEFIAVAVDDVMKAMTAQTTVEYLEARGGLGDRSAFESVMSKVADAASADDIAEG